jgi:outer membrane protein TolC
MDIHWIFLNRYSVLTGFWHLDQADSQILQAEAELNAAQQDLMVRVSERYFEVLAAIDNLDFARAEKISSTPATGTGQTTI